jgi:hypothetical protein
MNLKTTLHLRTRHLDNSLSDRIGPPRQAAFVQMTSRDPDVTPPRAPEMRVNDAHHRVHRATPDRGHGEDSPALRARGRESRAESTGG